MSIAYDPLDPVFLADPYPAFAWLRENDILHERDFQAIEAEVAAEVEAAVAFAEAGTWEPVADLGKHVTLEAAS